MSEILVVGLSHHTAPLAVRERLSVATERVGEELGTLVDGHAIGEGILVSTCNRVELYVASEEPTAAGTLARRYLAERAGGGDIDDYLYERSGEDAVRHAFRVAASLDSMVVGEPQILGQFKSAYSAAEAAGKTGSLLGRCFHRAFAVAKRVRSETGIAAGAVSVSSIAIELANKIFGNLSGRRALLVGAGKMSEAAAKSLSNRGARLYVVNRSPERAETLAAACDGQARPYEHLSSELAAADVVITSTASPRFIITRDLMRDVLKARRHRPLFLIDIAVPRDVDPRAGDMENIFLYDVDDLQAVASENIAARRREAAAAERIVSFETDAFEHWRRSLSLTPTIVALRERFRVIVRSELERTLPRLKNLNAKERKSLDAMAEAIVNKLLHQPLVQLKTGGDGPEAARLIGAARQLFELDAEGDTSDADAQRQDVVGRLAPAGGGNRGEGR